MATCRTNAPFEPSPLNDSLHEIIETKYLILFIFSGLDLKRAHVSRRGCTHSEKVMIMILEKALLSEIQIQREQRRFFRERLQPGADRILIEDKFEANSILKVSMIPILKKHMILADSLSERNSDSNPEKVTLIDKLKFKGVLALTLSQMCPRPVVGNLHPIHVLILVLDNLIHVYALIGALLGVRGNVGVVIDIVVFTLYGWCLAHLAAVHNDLAQTGGRLSLITVYPSITVHSSDSVITTEEKEKLYDFDNKESGAGGNEQSHHCLYKCVHYTVHDFEDTDFSLGVINKLWDHTQSYGNETEGDNGDKAQVAGDHLGDTNVCDGETETDPDMYFGSQTRLRLLVIIRMNEQTSSITLSPLLQGWQRLQLQGE